jgi:hypothetical protein
MDRTSRQIKRDMKNRLLNRGSPRLQMCLILSFTGLSAFAVSTVMVNLGFYSMWLRYLAAMVFAYVGFIFSINMWVRYALVQADFTADAVDSIEDCIDCVDAADDISSAAGSKLDITSQIGSGGKSGSSGGASDIFGFDLDESAVIVIITVAGLSLLIISIYLIYIAPVFLGEILVDAGLMSGVYKRIRTLQRESWITGAIRGSWHLFAIATVIVVLGGYLVQYIDPDIETIGDIFRMFL